LTSVDSFARKEGQLRPLLASARDGQSLATFHCQQSVLVLRAVQLAHTLTDSLVQEPHEALSRGSVGWIVAGHS
jgi:hypothetical protein